MTITERGALRKHIPISLVTYYFPYAHYVLWREGTSPCTLHTLPTSPRRQTQSLKDISEYSLCKLVFERRLSQPVVSSTEDWIKLPSWKMYLIYSVGTSKLPYKLIFVSKDNFSSLHLF